MTGILAAGGRSEVLFWSHHAIKRTNPRRIERICPQCKDEAVIYNWEETLIGTESP